jgi:glycosyltransferase involved in cell wall biosynthesis
MHRVLWISNVLGPCRYWVSEQRRTSGFLQFLAESGWACLPLVKKCTCPDLNAHVPGRVHVEHTTEPTQPRMDRVVKDHLGQLTEPGSFVQLSCAPRWFFRAWFALARAAGYRFASAEDEAEICHLVFPFPGFNAAGARETGGLRRCLLPLVKAVGLLLGRVHEQDRIDWTCRGTRTGVALARELQMGAVVGSYPGTQNLRIAAAVAQRTGVPWIADFRDCVSRGWCSSEADKSCVRNLLKTASAAVYVTPQEAERDAGLRRADMPTEIIENGFMPDAAPETRERAVENGRFTVRFLGAVYPQRNLGLFLDGLQRLAESDAELRSGLAFEYYGSMFDEVRAELERRGLQSFCRSFEPVNSSEALRLTAEADVLVLPTDVSGMSGVPGAKFYEYLGFRRPILAAGGCDAYVADVLARTGAGRGCWSVEDVSAVLGDWFRDWRERGFVDLPFDEAETARYSRREGARRLAELLDEVDTAGVARRAEAV